MKIHMPHRLFDIYHKTYTALQQIETYLSLFIELYHHFWCCFKAYIFEERLSYPSINSKYLVSSCYINMSIIHVAYL